MADNTVNTNLNFNTNASKAKAEVDALSSSISHTAAAIDGLTGTLKKNGTAVLENGGAMGLLNDLTGGYAMMVKDAVEALELFTSAKKVDTATTTANTAATEAGVVATESMTIAQKAFNLVASANPYILLATALIATATATVYFVNKKEDEAKALIKVNSEINKSKKATDDLSESIKDSTSKSTTNNDIEILRAKSLGATTAEIRKLIAAQNDRAVSEAVINSTNAYNNAVKASNAYTKALMDGNEEAIKSGKEVYEEAQKLSNQAAEAIPIARANQTKALLQSKIEYNAEVDALDKKTAAKNKSDKEALAISNKEAEDKRMKGILDNIKKESDASIELNNSLNQLEKDKNDRIEENAKKEGELAAFRQQIREYEYNKILEDDEKIKNSKIGLAESISSSMMDISSAFDENNKAHDAFVTASVQLDRIMADGSITASEALEAGLAVASSALGKQSAAGKAAAIASTTINTYKSATSAFAGMTETVPGPVGISLGVAAAAAAVVSGLANVKKILSVKVPGGGGNSASSGGYPSVSSGGYPSVPQSLSQPNVSFVSSSENQLQQSINTKNSEQSPIKAYVVASDVTNQQVLDEKIKNQTTM